MKVRDICKRQVVTVRPQDELLSAARVMRNKHVGYLVVVEPGLKAATIKPVGVLTDRDLVVSVMAREVNPATLCVSDVMTRELVAACEDDALRVALAQMRRLGVRRLPVIGEYGELTGVISLDDIIDALALELSAVAGSIRAEQQVEQALRS